METQLQLWRVTRNLHHNHHSNYSQSDGQGTSRECSACTMIVFAPAVPTWNTYDIMMTHDVLTLVFDQMSAAHPLLETTPELVCSTWRDVWRHKPGAAAWQVLSNPDLLREIFLWLDDAVGSALGAQGQHSPPITCPPRVCRCWNREWYYFENRVRGLWNWECRPTPLSIVSYYMTAPRPRL